MTDLLTLGASGLRAYRAALAGVSENIANADDPNYVRRNVRLAEAPANQAVNPIYLRNNDFHGSVIGGVERQSDMFADAQLRRSGADAGAASARLRWTGAAEDALNDGPNGVGARLGAFFDAGNRLAANPNDPALRSDMMARLDFSVRGFTQTADRLNTVASGIAEAADGAVNDLNQRVDQLAAINTNLLRATPGTQSHAALLDSRDAALADISTALPLTISFGMHGTVTLSLNGDDVLAPGVQGSFALVVAGDGRLGLILDSAAATIPDSGVLSGLASAADAVAGQRTALDTLADTLQSSLNSWNMAGQTPSGGAGAALLSGAGAAGLSLLSNDPDMLASASSSSANGNLLALGNLRGSAGAESAWNTQVATLGVLTQQARAEDAAATSLYEQAQSARDQVSGVDLDREAAELIRLQQAYDATARILQVARETIQSILNII